ncbi:MAG: hypothetical protein HYU97_11130 [Deltaproteobacteria bacterium]|nr:hypothetical protein [Deltaproteobacteria bacterium]
MKVKTSITLSASILEQLSSLETKYTNRSKLIEEAIVLFLEKIKKEVRNQNDLSILNKNSDSLNKEALEVLEFQN